MNASRNIPALLIALVAPLSLVSLALAYSTGVDSTQFSVLSNGCNDCHSGGTTPVVNLSGAITVNRGNFVPVTLTITGGAAVKGGMNARLSASSATAFLAESSSALKIVTGTNGSNEVTHSAPGNFSMGSISYTFQLYAGLAATCNSTVTLTAWGLSANGINAQNGDSGSVASQPYTITCPPEDIFQNGFEDAG